MHKALREALANCLINADFYVGRGIVIKKDINTIVIENPGYVRVGKRQMLKGGISDPRNKALMKMFNLIGIGERAGSGVTDIFSVWEQEGWKEPVVEEIYGVDRTILKLPLIKKSVTKISDKKSATKISDKKVETQKTKENLNKILKSMEFGITYKTTEVAEIVGLKDARVRELLKVLVERRKIEAIGSNKNRRYIRVNDKIEEEMNNEP